MPTIQEVLEEQLDSGSAGGYLRYGYWLLLVAVFGFAFWIRSTPAQQMQYLQALDPYMIARLSASIVEHGHLPPVDPLRFFPFTTPTYLMNLGNIVIPAYLFYIAKFFGVNFLTWVKLFPALLGALAVIPVYLIGSEVFDRKTGLLSAFFLSASVAIMHRSSAGWFEKEPIANLLMLFSMYFFIRAWNRRDWLSGIGSGVTLGLAATAWGGANFLFLLYPLTAFVVLVGLPLITIVPALIFGKELRSLDIHENFVAAYLPMAIIATILPWILNASSSTWSIPNQFFLVNIGVALFVTVRHYGEEFEVVPEDYLPFYSIGMFVAGLVALALSPLYSQTLWRYTRGALNSALQSGGSVIGGTVAENQPASLNEVVSNIGASYAGALIPQARVFTEYMSGWTLGLLGGTILAVALVMMTMRYYFDWEEVQYSTLLGSGVLAVSFLGIVLSVEMGQNINGLAMGVLPLLAISTLGGILLYFGEYLFADEFQDWLGGTLLIWIVIFVMGIYMFFTRGSQTIFNFIVIWTGILGLFFLFVHSYVFRDVDGYRRSVTVDWTKVILFLWIGSTVYGATQKSRLLFLAATPVAMVAGIGVSKAIDEFNRSGMWSHLNEQTDAATEYVPKLIAVTAVILLVVVNGAAVYVMGAGTEVNGRNVGGLGGSPNSAWMDNMDYMREETPPGSVILSWWDYGYWFQTLGDRAAIADGGNMGYYREAMNGTKINQPLADFLTASNQSEWRGWLDRHSVDYIVLDSSMIGKYSAVSQIANWDNQQFDQILTFSCQRNRRTGQCGPTQVGNQTVVKYNLGGLGDYLAVPMNVGSGSDTAPVMVINGRQVPVANVCVPEEGVVSVSDKATTSGNIRQSLMSRQAYTSLLQGDRAFGGCVAFHPTRGMRSITLVSPDAMRSTFARLYLMDGAGIDYVEKEEYFGNGFVKMWEVTE